MLFAVVTALPFVIATQAHAQAGSLITFDWDSAPHTVSTARNAESLVTLYGRGIDRLFKAASIDGDRKGRLARILKTPGDVYVAWLATLLGHEFGHCQRAWLAGSRDCHWVSAPGPYALGHIISVGDAGQLSAAGRLGITAGGVQSSVVGADDVRREMFGQGPVHWSLAPLLVVRQLDLTQYGLTAPSPANAAPADYANDMTNYAIRYGSRSGRGGELVHQDIVHGAIWNTVDPASWFAAWSYFADYVAHGRTALRPQGFFVGDLRWMVGTHAWLSEVGVRYSLGVFVRSNLDVLEVTPSWGEGQPAANVRWTRILPPDVTVTINGDFWRQRESASPGPRQTGGSLGAGLSRSFGRLVISADAGYKTAGAMLARPQARGWWWGVGAGWRIGS